MMTNHNHAMKINEATLSNNLVGFIMIFSLIFISRTIGVRTKMNITGNSHNIPNSGRGNPSWKFRLFINSRIMSGSTRMKLMIAGNLRCVNKVFI
jgi:hypothetical protein